MKNKQTWTHVKASLASFVMMLMMVFTMSITAQAASQPTDLVQTGDSTSYVKVQFTPVSDANAKYYGYQVATDTGFTNIVKNGSVLSTSIYISAFGLTSGTTYYVRIGYGSAYDDCYQNWSSTLEVVTAPAADVTPKFSGADDTTFTLTWGAVAGANQYKVRYNDAIYYTDQTTYVLPYSGDSSALAYVYPVRVSSSGYVAEGSYKYVSGCTALTTKIAKDNFGLLYAYTSTNKFYVGVVNSFGEGYEVKMYNAKTGKCKATSTAKMSSILGAEFTGLKLSTMFKYRVRAYVTTTDGNKIYGSWSAYRYIVNPKKATYSTSGKKIKLSWSKLTGVSKIKVQISTNEDSGYKTCKTLKGTKTSYTITKCGKKALKKGKTYYVRIVYYAKGGKSSDVISQTSVTVK